jgi:hypothetical protein
MVNLEKLLKEMPGKVSFPMLLIKGKNLITTEPAIKVCG